MRRTGLRKSSGSISNDGTESTRLSSTGLAVDKALVNLTWNVVLFGALLAPAMCGYFIWSLDEAALEGVSKQDYEWSIKLMGFAIFLELLSEVSFVGDKTFGAILVSFNLMLIRYDSLCL